MEIVNELSYRIGENASLVICEDSDGHWWHCLAWRTEETDWLGPFSSKYAALFDAKATYLDPEWAEMGWMIHPQLLDAVTV